VRLVRSLVGSCVLVTAAVLCPLGAGAATHQIAVPTVASPPPLDPKADETAWADAKAVTLTWDVQHQKPSSESSVAHIATDGTFLYVRFDNAQREGLLQQQHTNDVGDGTDDEVWVDLWPNGPNGFYYQFAATSNGTHFQYSSENTAYDPSWESFGATVPGGWVTTMKIPLKVIRGSGASDWRLQFVRVVRSTGERQIWSWGPLQTNGDDVNYAGPAIGMPPAAVSRAKPRVALYALGAQGHDPGLSTSRMGADFSLPVTATSSVYGTIHPDFSNVEVDQQTIAPTAYQRVYTEVRPFFTQGANYYDPFDCDVCPGTYQLYTPSIPTPRDGYAFEGKQGLFSFAGFDAIGDGRDDGATMLQMHTPNNYWSYAIQQVDADLPGLVDRTTTTGIHFNDSQHIDAFFNFGEDQNTAVPDDDGRNKRIDGGAYYYTNTYGLGASLRDYGQYYTPVDGYIQHPDISGYAVFQNKEWLFPATSWLDSIQFWQFEDRYHDHTGALDQTDNNVSLDVLMHDLIDIQGGIGSSYLRLPSGIFTPVSQDGIQFTWHSGTANNPGNNGNHGSSATPTVVSWNGGRFGPGRLDAWLRSSTMRAGKRATLTLEADDTDQTLDRGGRNVQWLERASYNYAIGANESVAFGIRRIDGTAPLIDQTAPPLFINAWNVSFDYHKRVGPNELYFAYGDASQVYTVHQWILKLIHYFGAEKGT